MDHQLWLLYLLGAGILAMKLVFVGNWLFRFNRMSDSQREAEIKSLRLDEDASGWG